jgi:hypothetical protein
MRLILGVVSLLVVLAIVGTLGKNQLEAFGRSGQAATKAAGLAGTAPAAATTPAQAKALQNNVRDAVNASLQQGADRAAEQAKP